MSTKYVCIFITIRHNVAPETFIAKYCYVVKDQFLIFRFQRSVLNPNLQLDPLGASAKISAESRITE